MSPNQNRGEKRLSREQKTGFVLLLVFGILVIGLGFLQMRHTIQSPFLIQSIVQKQTSRPVQSLFDARTRLQQVDTDQDGLNDYEEIEFYQTSAYLPDTDSDGIEDKVEIENGTDPLCAEGTECERADESGPLSTVTTTDIQPLELVTPDQIFADALETVGADGLAEAPPDDATIEALTSNPDLVRQLLLQSGQVTEAELDTFSDDQLLTLTRQLVDQYNTSQPAPTTPEIDEGDQ